MLQFYFLSVLLNVLAGLVLVYATDLSKKHAAAEGEEVSDDSDATIDEGSESAKKIDVSKLFTSGAFLDDLNFRLVLGILSVLVGVMKLLSTVQGDAPVIGDLVPAFAGIAAGASILLEFYNVKNVMGTDLPAVVNKIFLEGRKYIGVFCIIAGVMHFIFPRVLFL